MKRTAVAAYLAIPALLTLGTFVVALRREAFGLEMFAAVVVGGYFFYAAPHLLWVLVASLVKFSNALWHAGLIAGSVALAAIAALWLFPGDPSGLPMQWLLYWPLALVLQVVLAGLTALHRRVRAPNSALLTDTFSSPLRAQHGAAKRER
jgi:hypothetical protein